MLTRTAESARDRTSSSPGLLKKIWLPKLIYDCLPYFYIVAGIVALLTTLYISNWYWVVPHYLLFSVACAHFGVIVLRRRRRKN